jgi:hypothetical protein
VQVLIGNAKGVVVLADGQSLDLVSSTRANVARFRWPQ